MIDFPSNPALDDIFTDASFVQWRCIDATVGDVQWAREGVASGFEAAPIGSIVAWANTSLPLGWIECAGQATTGFPALADIVGANVPDLRGEFIRGFDNGKGTDVGRVLGSSQADEFESHNHTINVKTNASGLGGSNIATGNAASDDTRGSNTAGGTETRPRNVALIYIIKAFNVVSEGQVSGFVSPNKNYIINPTFSINQRGFAGGLMADLQFAWDRWKASGTVTANLSGIEITTSGGNGLLQWIEDFGYTGQVTLSWEGTATITIGSTGLGATDSNVSSPYTFNVNAGDNFWFRIDGGTLSKPKLETGSVQTPFEYPDLATELVKCQRYYYQNTTTLNQNARQFATIGTSFSASSLRCAFVHFPVVMQRVPDMKYFPSEGGAAGEWNYYQGGWKAGVISGSAIVNNGFQVNFTGISGMVTADSYLVHGNYTADAEI